LRVALLGATGAVGRTMLEILDARHFEIDELVPLASARSRGTRIRFRDRDWCVEEPTGQSFLGCDLALFSAGAARSRAWAPVAADAGAMVIDNSSAWRMDPDVPLVVPEVNASALLRPSRGIIANPNCATIQIVIALEALRRAGGLRSVIATTFQSVSGAGQSGIDALDSEAAGRIAADSPFVRTIAGNVVPWIGPRLESGWNEEEEKVRNETRRILDMPDLPVTATCVRVPVRVGHAAAVTARLEQALSRDSIEAAFRAMPGIAPGERDADPTPLDVAGTDDVRVGRVRIDPDDPRTVHFWVVADNLRKGAATNAVQIAERLRDG
jgi:aspartate-semialdehyde dehydrogenase